MRIPKNISQEIIDELHNRGYEAGYQNGLNKSITPVYQRAWISGVRQAIRLQPRYYRPHNEATNRILDPYLERLREAIKKPPTPHKTKREET